MLTIEGSELTILAESQFSSNKVRNAISNAGLAGAEQTLGEEN